MLTLSLNQLKKGKEFKTMPRKKVSENTVTLEVGKVPSKFPYRVSFIPSGTTQTRVMQSYKPDNILQYASQVRMTGASQVTIESWNTETEAWEANEPLNDKLNALGGFNPMTRLELAQLVEITQGLQANAASQNGLNGELVITWLQQFFRAARTMGVREDVVSDEFFKAFNVAQEA